MPRPTRDVDLLGFGPADVESVANTLREILSTAVEDDGLVFHVDSLEASRISEGDKYEGVHIRVDADLGGAKLRLQVDVGFGDSVAPAPISAEFPSLLGMEMATVLAYPPESIIAEKFEAVVDLGMANSRLKDFFDIWLLANCLELDRASLEAAVRATLVRRGTRIPTEPPLAFSAEFHDDSLRNRQWDEFASRTGAGAAPSLAEVTQAIARLLMPLIWQAGESGTWSPTEQEWRPRR